MDGKSAFVFDTNFIIENLNLKEVVTNLSDKFSVYVTQVSIDERISQKYMDIKNKYDKLTKLTEDYKGIASIRITTSLEKRNQAEKELTQRGYIDLFAENIIPFVSDEVTFTKVLDRVYKKIPPFLSVDGASDKGFKDSLIWISLLDFFKSNGGNEVVFVTNDNGFRKNAEMLCKEFRDYTGKSIAIKDNGYYKTLFEIKEVEGPQTSKDNPLPDVNQLRGKVHKVIYALCGVDSGDYWGGPDWNKTFTLNQKVDSAYMEVVFSQLKQDIKNNIFESEILADKILGLDDRVENNVSIPMSALESALSLYEEINSRLPEYLPQFYSAAASIINGNYVERLETIDDDDDLPF